MLTIHYVDFIPVVRNHLRALEKIQIWMMNVFEKVVSIYFFRYDLAVKNIEFRSFRFLKFLYCFQCLFVFPVCHILIRIYNYFFFHEEQVEDNTWMHLDMEYLFQYSTQ